MTAIAPDELPPKQESASPAAFAVPERQALQSLAAFMLITVALIISVSYIDEDAFISFRAVENFVHGHGLKWNLDERVQAFTNPLWVLLLIPVRALLGDVLRASMVMSVLCSTAAVGVVAWEFRKHALVFAFALFLPLFLSRAFTDYTNSGFENPLTFLFLGLFAVRFFKDEATIPWRPLTALVALIGVNRLDAVVLLAPAMVWLFLANRKAANYKQILVGALPLIGWLLFSLFYFGMPYPNTKYAKLDAGFGPLVYVENGFVYLLDIIRNDTTTFGAIVFGVGVSIYGMGRWFKTRQVVWGKVGSLGLGVLVSLIYVIYVGGDFMAGRHWSSPFFLSVLVVLFAIRESRLTDPMPMLSYATLLLGLRFGVESLAAQRDTLQTRDQDRFAIVRTKGIRDQRFNCSFYEALIGARGPATEHSWSQAGIRFKQQGVKFLKENPGQRFVVVHGGGGKAPFYAGEDVVFVDPLAITDPLLARLPDSDGKFWFSGHLERHVPTGYVTARRTGSLDEMDPDLAKYYAELRFITAGPLFSWERLVKVARFHLGQFEPYRKAYVAKGYPEEMAKLREEREKREKEKKEKEKEKKEKERKEKKEKEAKEKEAKEKEKAEPEKEEEPPVIGEKDLP